MARMTADIVKFNTKIYLDSKIEEFERNNPRRLKKPIYICLNCKRTHRSFKTLKECLEKHHKLTIGR